MRRLFVVFALLAMMAGLDALKTQSAASSNPLTLAAIGFVVLAAFALAELGSRLSLPKVTGYILSGVALGPFAIDVLSTSVVTELRMFSTLALGLIAITAGLELDLRGLASLTRTLAITVGIKIVLGLGLVGGSVAAIAYFTGWLGPMPPPTLVSLALVFGALSLGTSPAIALAVASESRAKGRLTDLVLGAAVVKDVVVVVCLAIAMATASAMLQGGSLEAEVFVHLGEELGGSILLGVGIGALLIGYLRWVRLEMLLVVAVVVLIVAEVCAALHLELLLVLIVAGATVRNFSPYEESLHHPLQTISLPVFVVFFTNAGASVDLGATWDLLPFALALCGVRALGFFVAGELGGRWGRESEPVRRNAWLGYLPQAGVTLGLVDLATHKLPDLAGQIQPLGMAVVAVNLLAGPITLRLALRRAGEVPDGDAEEHATTSDSTTSRPDGEREEIPLESPELLQLVTQVRDVLQDSWSAWRKESLAPELDAWAACIRLDPGTRRDGPAAVSTALDHLPALWAEQRAEALRQVLQLHHLALQELPPEVRVPLEPRLSLPAPGDPFRMRLAKSLAGWRATLMGQRNRRSRDVPVLMTARTIVEPAMAHAAAESLRDVIRFEVHCLELLQSIAVGQATWEDGRDAMDRLVESTRLKIAENQRTTMERALRDLRRALACIGGPGYRVAQTKYARVAEVVGSVVHGLADESKQWIDGRAAAIRTLRLVVQVEEAQLQLQRDVTRDVIAPLDGAFEQLRELVTAQRERVLALPKAAELTDEESWKGLEARVHATIPKPAQKELRSLMVRVRRATSASAPLSGASSFVSDGDASIRLFGSLHDLARAPRPHHVEPITVDVRELKEVQIAQELLPSIAKGLEEAQTTLTSIREGMSEAASLVEFGFQAGSDAANDASPDGASLFDQSIDRASAMLDELAQAKCGSWPEFREPILAGVDQMADRLIDALAAIHRRSLSSTVGTERVHRVRALLRTWVRAALARGRHLLTFLRTRDASRTADDLAQRYRLRTGDERVDAQGIRFYLDEQARVRVPGIEGLYGSLFTSAPLRDPRLFTANRTTLTLILRAARAWQSDPLAGNAALVLGGSGSGKSSVLSVAQLKLGARRLFHLRRGVADEGGLLDAFGRAMGCEPALDAIARALKSQRAVVILDDLHLWFSPGPSGPEQVRALQELIAQTQSSAFYLASMADHAFELWHGILPLEPTFSCIERLRAVDVDTLDGVVSARHDLARMPLQLPASARARFNERVLGRPIRASFLRDLTRLSGGNLRRAITLWIAHARAENEQIVLLPLTALRWSLPFVHQLGPDAIAVLATLLRHGPQPETALSQALGLPESDGRGTCRFLVAARLAGRDPASDRLFVRPELADDLALSLRELGVLGGVG